MALDQKNTGPDLSTVGPNPPAGPDKVLRKGFVFAGRYQIEKPLGTGTLGAVYLAEDLLEKSLVAVKVFYRDRMNADGVQKRFQRFMKMAQEIQQPHFVSLLRFGETEDGFFAVREFIDGQPLDHLILERKKAKKNFRLEEVFSIFSDVARALSSIEQETFHGSLFPSNLLITEDRVVITDLGVARIFQPAQFSSLQIYHGNGYYYLAPEYDRAGAKIDQRADLYSAAVIAYEMLTGEIPRSPVIPPSVVNPEVPLGLDGPFLKALQLDSEQRQENLQQFIEQLRTLSGMVETNINQQQEVFEDSGLHEIPRLSLQHKDPPIELSSDFMPALFREKSESKQKDIRAEIKTPNFTSDTPISTHVKSATQVRGGIPTFPKNTDVKPAAQKMPTLPTRTRPAVLPPMDLDDSFKIPTSFRYWPLLFTLGIVLMLGGGWVVMNRPAFFGFDSKPTGAVEGAKPVPESVAAESHPPQVLAPQPMQEPVLPPAAEPLPKNSGEGGPASGGDGSLASSNSGAGGIQGDSGLKAASPEGSTALPAAKKTNANPCPKDMVFVPAGSFLFGNAAADRDFLDVAPRKVALSSFCVDRYEWPNLKGQRVLTKVSFQAAANMCSQEGKRLCTEAEWERACKGSAQSAFPYGDRFTENYCQTKSASNAQGPVRSGALPRCKSSFAAFDLSGNVAEWTAGKWSAGKADRMVRGGSFRSSDWAATCSSRKNFLPETLRDDLGFRCCQEPQSDSTETVAGNP